MIHTYAKSVTPPVFGGCDKPVASIGYFSNNVLAFCETGHMIRGRLVGAGKEKAYAERMAKKLKVKAHYLGERI